MFCSSFFFIYFYFSSILIFTHFCIHFHFSSLGHMAKYSSMSCNIMCHVSIEYYKKKSFLFTCSCSPIHVHLLMFMFTHSPNSNPQPNVKINQKVTRWRIKKSHSCKKPSHLCPTLDTKSWTSNNVQKQKRESKSSKGGNTWCVLVEHYLKSLFHTSVLLLILDSPNSILDFEFLEESRLPNGLPPPMNIGGEWNHSKEIFQVNSKFEIVGS
jgi:hypothetical protein